MHVAWFLFAKKLSTLPIMTHFYVIQNKNSEKGKISLYCLNKFRLT